jgi:hypothetical protein
MSGEWWGDYKPCGRVVAHRISTCELAMESRTPDAFLGPPDRPGPNNPSEIASMLYGLLTLEDDDLPDLLAELLNVSYFEDVETCHIQKLVNCLDKPNLVDLAFDVLIHIAMGLPPIVRVFSDCHFFSIIPRFLSLTNPLTAKAFNLLRRSFFSVKEPRRYVFEGPCFHVLEDRLPPFDDGFEDAEFVRESAQVIKLMTSVPDFPYGFVTQVLPILTGILDSLDASVILIGLESFLNLHANGCDLGSFALDSSLIEDLTSLLCRRIIDRKREIEVRAMTLRLLSILCVYGDELLNVMKRFGTPCEVKLAVESREDAIVFAAIRFFEYWLDETGNQDYLFDQVTLVNFAQVCENAAFRTKEEMMRLVFTICESASQLHIKRLMTPAFIEIAIDQVGCLSDDASWLIYQSIRQACVSCQGDPEFLAAVAGTVGALAVDDEEKAKGFEIMVGAIHGFL